MKRCYQLEGGMGGTGGRITRGAGRKEGRGGRDNIPISIKNILKAFKMPGVFQPDFKHSYPIMLHPSHFQSAKTLFSNLKGYSDIRCHF